MAVRRERVELSLHEDVSTGMLKAAAATALLEKELNRLSGQSVDTSKSTRDIDRDVSSVGRSAGKSAKEIDQFSGRLRVLTDAATILTPALAPLGTVGIAAVSGLASSLGFAAVGAGTAILAFQGIGDTLKAVNKAAIEPTTENLQAAHLAMKSLTPAAQDFVTELRNLGPELDHLKGIAAENLFPGLTKGIDELQTALPAVERIIGAVSAELGSIAEEAGASLASDRWQPFFEFIATEAPPALADLASAVGSTTHALAELWIAFTPLNRGFSDFLVSSTADLDRWASGLSKTQGFKEFVAYIHETGPQVATTLGAIANAFLQVIEAAAPLAGPVLSSLTALSNAIAAIADSDLGTPIYTAVTAMVLFSRTAQLANKSVTAFKGGLSGLSTGAKLGGVVLGIDLLSESLDRLLDHDLDSSNLGRSLTALAQGNVTGELKKYGSDLSGFADDIDLAGEKIGGFVAKIPAVGDFLSAPPWTKSPKDAADNIKKLDQALAGLVESGQADQAATIFDRLTKAAEEGGKSADDVAGFFKQYKVAVGNASAESTDFTLKAKAQNDALIAQRQAVREASNSFLAFDQNLDDSKVSLGDWIKSVQDQANALKNFAANSVKAADNGVSLGVINRLRNEGVAGALRLAQLAKANTDEVKATNAAQRAGNAAIKANVNAAEQLRKKASDIAAKKYLVKFKFDVDPKPAESVIDRLTRPRTVKIVAIGAGAGVLKEQFGGGNPSKAPGSANGGPIYGPGTATSDSIPAMLSNGEYVVRAAAVAKYGTGFFEQANQMRLAAGGPAAYLNQNQPSPWSPISGKPTSLADYLRSDLDLKFPQTLKEWNAALKASTKVVDAEKDQRQKLLDQAQSVKDAITNGYKSALFGQSADTSDLPDWLSADQKKALMPSATSTLQGDIGNLGALNAAIRTLTSKGLDGPALADLLSNASLSQVQDYAGQSRADLAQYETAYNQRDRLLGTSGNLAASASFGAQIAIANRQLAAANRIDASLKRLEKWAEKNPHATGQEVAKAINGAVTKGGRH